jgi:hypothetical protein
LDLRGELKEAILAAAMGLSGMFATASLYAYIDTLLWPIPEIFEMAVTVILTFQIFEVVMDVCRLLHPCDDC